MSKNEHTTKTKGSLGVIFLIVFAVVLIISGALFMNYVRVKNETAKAPIGGQAEPIVWAEGSPEQLLAQAADTPQESGSTLGSRTTNESLAATTGPSANGSGNSAVCQPSKAAGLKDIYDKEVAEEKRQHDMMLKKLVANALQNADAIQIENNAHLDRLAELKTMLNDEMAVLRCQ